MTKTLVIGALVLLVLAAWPLRGLFAANDGGGVLFSALEGRLLRDGQPVRGATLLRQWQFDERSVKGEDRAVTDEDGRFAFPQVVHRYRKSRVPFFAQQTVVAQRIEAVVGGKPIELWVGSKHTFQDGDELQRSDDFGATQGPLRAVFDLSRPLVLRGRTAIRAADVDGVR